MTEAKEVTEQSVLHEVIELNFMGRSLDSAIELVQSRYAGQRLSKKILKKMALDYIKKDH